MNALTSVLKIINILAILGLLLFFVLILLFIMGISYLMNMPYLGLGSINLALPTIFLACAFLNFRSVHRYERQEIRAGVEVYAANILAGVAAAGAFIQLGGWPDPLTLALPGAYLTANLCHAILTRRYCG